MCNFQGAIAKEIRIGDHGNLIQMRCIEQGILTGIFEVLSTIRFVWVLQDYISKKVRLLDRKYLPTVLEGTELDMASARVGLL